MEEEVKSKLYYVTNNMKALRARNGFKQEDVANILEVTRATYCGYETNPHKVPLEVIYKLSVIFKCKVSDFFVEYNVTESHI